MNLRAPVFRSCVVLLSIAAGSPVTGQEFRIGFIGGTSITSNYATATSTYPGDTLNPPSLFTAGTGQRSFLAGLSLEALLSRRFSVEANVLHRDLWAKTIYTENPGTSAASTSLYTFIASTTWEFPVLFKYTMAGSRWRPFIDGGVSFRSLERTGAPGPSRYGLTGGAGVAIGFGRLQLTPQLRYTRWAKADSSNGYYDVKRDQLEFLTGISYRLPTAAHMGDLRMAVGVLGGVRLNETLAGVPNRINRRFFGGVSLDVNVGSGFSVEADGIYKPIGISKYSVLTWEFPVLLKHRWTVRGARLFGEVGPSFRVAGNLQSSIPPSHFGVTAGAGIEKWAGHVRIAPTLRYTRWAQGQRHIGSGLLAYNPNSMDLLVGFSF